VRNFDPIEAPAIYRAALSPGRYGLTRFGVACILHSSLYFFFFLFFFFFSVGFANLLIDMDFFVI
jgi:hypothetical protein